MIYTKDQADQARYSREHPYLKSRQTVKPVPVPVKPAKRGLGDWGWCGVGEGAVPDLVTGRHFKPLDWQVWQQQDQQPKSSKLLICETCALQIMGKAGYGSRLPYEAEIPEELGGRYRLDGTLVPVARSNRAPARINVTNIRIGIVTEALERHSPLTWNELLALKDEDGNPLFPSLNALKYFMRTHLKGGYTVSCRGSSGVVTGYPSLRQTSRREG